MTPQRWQQVEDLFHATLQCPGPKRSGFLQQACGEDAALAAEVQSLLDSHEAGGATLEQPPSALAAELLGGVIQSSSLKGRTLGKYQVQERIGAGGMGEVYRAVDLTLQRQVALKVLPRGAGAENVRRFVTEARAASAVNHPNIATVYEIGESSGAVYIAMELVEGQTLAAISKPVSLPVLQGWAVQMAAALGAAHKQGVIHRDIKPGNIMVAGGNIKVLDFGLAKALTPDSVHTDTGVVMGTVRYMSPEQLRGLKVDNRTDLFSLGAVLFELAAGVPPFRGAVAPETMARILNSPPSAEGDAIPPQWRKIIYRCLEKDADRRYANAAALLADLATLHQPGSLAGRRWIIGAAAGLAAAGGLAWFVRVGAPRPEIRSLAVLPLVNLSGQSDQEYFSDGMTEALTSALARIRLLRVISRSSAMQYKNTSMSLREVAAKLGVDAVVEGSVLRGAGGRVRITVQLIDAASDTHLWSKDYERDAADILNLQREVAAAVAGEVRLQLAPRSSPPVSAGAQENYLRGRFHWNRRTSSDLKQAAAYFENAIRLSADYAAAHVGLADTYLLLTPYAGLSPAETYPKAEASARRALEIDPGNGEAHATLGVIEHEYNWNHAGAREHFDQALSLEPNYTPAHQWYAEFLTRLREPEKSLERILAARQLDPLSLIVRAVHGWVLHHAGRSAEAVEQLRDTLVQDSRFLPAHGYLGQAYSAMGRHEDAVRHLETAVELSHRSTRYVSALAVALAASGRIADARRAGDEVVTASAPAVQVAAVYLALGDETNAWIWLDRAARERGVWTLFLNFDRLYARLRTQPRFQAVLAQAGF